MPEKYFSANVDICTAGVCTELDTGEATMRLNREHPTGTTTRVDARRQAGRWDGIASDMSGRFTTQALSV